MSLCQKKSMYRTKKQDERGTAAFRSTGIIIFTSAPEALERIKAPADICATVRNTQHFYCNGTGRKLNLTYFHLG